MPPSGCMLRIKKEYPFVTASGSFVWWRLALGPCNDIRASPVKAGWSAVDQKPLVFWLCVIQAVPLSIARWTSLRSDVLGDDAKGESFAGFCSTTPDTSRILSKTTDDTAANDSQRENIDRLVEKVFFIISSGFTAPTVR